MSHLDADDLQTLGSLIEQKVQQAEEQVREQEKEKRQRLGFKHWCRRCVLMVIVFGVGVLLHHLIEDSHLRSAAQSVELALTALYAFVFERVRDTV